MSRKWLLIIGNNIKIKDTSTRLFKYQGNCANLFNRFDRMHIIHTVKVQIEILNMTRNEPNESTNPRNVFFFRLFYSMINQSFYLFYIVQIKYFFYLKAQFFFILQNDYLQNSLHNIKDVSETLWYKREITTIAKVCEDIK